MGSGSILVAIAGIIGMAGEFRFGRPTRHSSPNHGGVVLAAKLMLYTVLGAVFGVIAGAATLGTMWVAISSEGLTLQLGQSFIWTTLGGAVASAALFGALGCASGCHQEPGRRDRGRPGLADRLRADRLRGLHHCRPLATGAAAQSLRRIPQDGLLPWIPALRSSVDGSY
ncbi:hypothetical protein NKG94_49155 [Micromonospora sp. M12]